MNVAGETTNSSTLPSNTTVTGDGAHLPCFTFPDGLRIFSLLCDIFVGISTLYLTISLTQHYIMELRRGSSRGKNRGSISSIHAGQGRKGRLFKQLMGTYTISAAIFILVRCILDIIILETGFISSPYYVGFSRAEIILNIAALSCIYLILWIRLWSFYCHPGLDDDRFVRLKYVCLGLLFVMIATGVYNAFAFLTDRNISVDAGCIKTEFTNSKFYILGCCTLFYQAVLLWLFAYPLFLHARNSVLNESSKKKSIMKVLKRVFVVAIICCVTDLITSILSAVLEHLYPECSFVIYNINIASNLFALLYSFSDWKIRILYPFLHYLKSVPANWSAHTTVASNNQSS